MSGASQATTCPDCGAELDSQSAKLNVSVKLCPRNHGVLLEGESLTRLVTPETATRVHAEMMEGGPAGVDCPVCGGPLSTFRLAHVAAQGCSACGSLWFEHAALQTHVVEVRRRAFGTESFAARVDLQGHATPMHPAEIVAGLVKDYELHDDVSSSNI